MEDQVYEVTIKRTFEIKLSKTMELTKELLDLAVYAYDHDDAPVSATQIRWSDRDEVTWVYDIAEEDLIKGDEILDTVDIDITETDHQVN